MRWIKYLAFSFIVALVCGYGLPGDIMNIFHGVSNLYRAPFYTFDTQFREDCAAEYNESNQDWIQDVSENVDMEIGDELSSDELNELLVKISKMSIDSVKSHAIDALIKSHFRELKIPYHIDHSEMNVLRVDGMMKIICPNASSKLNKSFNIPMN